MMIKPIFKNTFINPSNKSEGEYKKGRNDAINEILTDISRLIESNDNDVLNAMGRAIFFQIKSKYDDDVCEKEIEL